MEILVIGLTIFVLAIFVGFEIITKVPPTLHTPLMSGSNAISGITLVGAILSAGLKFDYLTTVLGFAAVVYKAGAFFNRATNKVDSGYQIDLVFDRADNVYTICELKYVQAKVNLKIIAEFEKKLALFPNPKQKTIQKVLITTEGAEQSLINRGYFDRIITLADIFAAAIE